MKVDTVQEYLKNNKVLDNKKIYIYASSNKIIGGVIGAQSGLVLLSVNKDILYIHRANIDNSYGKRLAKIYISDMKNIQGKAGMFGGKFSFNYDGKEYRFKLPAKAEKFVDFFVK